MSFRFAGRIIANPAPSFFDQPIISSNDPELGGATSARTNPLTDDVAKLMPGAAHDQQLATKLAQHGIRYVLVARELDYQDYDYLRSTPGLTLARTSNTLLLYLNTMEQNQ
jgi:hypothetical protein